MRSIATLLLILLASVQTASAFEGAVRWRMVAGNVAQLSSLGVKPDDPQSLYAVTPEQLAKAGGVRESRYTLLIKGSRLKEVGAKAGEDGNYVVIDAESGSIWMVQPHEKRYVEWGKAEREATDQRAAAYTKKLEEDVAKATPEQKEAAQKRLAEHQAKAAAKPEVKSLNKEETVSGLKSSIYEIKILDRAARGWVSSEPADLVKTIRGAYAAREKMQVGPGGGRDPKSLLSEQGLPVRVVSIQGGMFRYEEIEAIEKREVAEQEVAIPADFQKADLREILKQALTQKLNKAVDKGLLNPGGAKPAEPAAPAKP